MFLTQNFLAKSLSLLFILLIANSVHAEKWRVNNTLNAPLQVDFNQLLDAVASNSVTSGDTIYVEGSATPYLGGVEVYKQLTIIGPGYFLNQPNLQPTLCRQLSARVVDGNGFAIAFLEGSDGSFITGMEISSASSAANVDMTIGNTSDITITRNKIDNINFNTSVLASDIIIHRNFIANGIYFGCSTLNSIIITNNLISEAIGTSCSSYEMNNSLILNNTLGNMAFIRAEGSVIAYNYVGYIDKDHVNMSVNNNILSLDNIDNQAIVAQDATNVIAPYLDDTFSVDQDNWTFMPVDETMTHGANNGEDPYYSGSSLTPANLPAWPVIYNCDVQSYGDTEIQVSFQVRVNH